ncbi:M48 family metallopeptidase [Sphingomonas sp. FW199]|uniref:M48 family metallopeptidase n=1 Tax=Sphingomonas sp. FW199 TaxID=3400217 RepID=UPI003CFAB782
MTAAIQVRRHPRARRMKLAVDPLDGTVTLTLPPRAALAPALAWAQGQQGWIAAQQARVQGAVPLADGSQLMVEGAEVIIRWTGPRRHAPELAGGVLACGGPSDRTGARVLRWLQDRALLRLSEDTADYAARAGVHVAGVGIGDPRRRWGSCASSGMIRYSWRLILAPPDVRRAVAAHEVAHRLHMNHGPAFHRAWEALYGTDPAPAMAWLRRNGRDLHRITA